MEENGKKDEKIEKEKVKNDNANKAQDEITEKEPEKKKKSKKPIIITLIIILVLIACAIGGFFIWKNIKENETVGTTWGDTYYAYLKEGTEQKDFASREKYGLQQNMSNTTLQFAEIEKDKAP